MGNTFLYYISACCHRKRNDMKPGDLSSWLTAGEIVTRLRLVMAIRKARIHYITEMRGKDV
jgi:hypothetical protein